MDLRIAPIVDHIAAAELLRVGVAASGETDVEREVTSTLALTGSGRGLTLAATDAAQGHRTLGVLFVALEEDRTVAFVRWLVVAPDQRRSGIGSALMDALERTPGIARVRGVVDRSDPVARRFWHSRGWRARPRPRRVLMDLDVTQGSRDPAA
jgi:GNAT superfamily N-acetyltransferase